MKKTRIEQPSLIPQEAPVIAVSSRHGVRSYLVACPRCQGEHTHGGGRLEEDPGAFLGHRVSHCRRDPVDYILTDPLNLAKEAS